MLSLGQKLTPESFHRHLLVVFNRTFLKQMRIFSRNLNNYWKRRAKINFSDNLGHNILKLYNVLIQIRLTTSKTKRQI